MFGAEAKRKVSLRKLKFCGKTQIALWKNQGDLPIEAQVCGHKFVEKPKGKDLPTEAQVCGKTKLLCGKTSGTY